MIFQDQKPYLPPKFFWILLAPIGTRVAWVCLLKVEIGTTWEQDRNNLKPLCFKSFLRVVGGWLGDRQEKQEVGGRTAVWATL